MRNRHVVVVVAILVFIGLLVTAKALGVDLKPGEPAARSEKWCVVPPRDGLRVNLDVLVDGRPVKLIAHDGRLYLPVPRIGAEYELRVNNRSARRITAVVAVDGLSVITSEPASDLHPGYLVDPADSIVIKGWRRDADTVAAFIFEERENSYAYQLGERDKIGTIELLAVEEYNPDPLPVMRTETSAKAAGSLGNSGTGWGRDINSSVTQVPFVRSHNTRTITIYYDTEEALRRIGVPVIGPRPKPLVAESR
jgi:hypothetical protein